MKTLGTYKITRQGQITLPAEAREELNLNEGDSIEIYSGSDLILIKKRRTPVQVFNELAKVTSERFKKKGLTRDDVLKEVKDYRNEKNKL
jgi:AbrB family looped-hinge helix DNA binding protein